MLIGDRLADAGALGDMAEGQESVPSSRTIASAVSSSWSRRSAFGSFLAGTELIS